MELQFFALQAKDFPKEWCPVWFRRPPDPARKGERDCRPLGRLLQLGYILHILTIDLPLCAGSRTSKSEASLGCLATLDNLWVSGCTSTILWSSNPFFRKRSGNLWYKY